MTLLQIIREAPKETDNDFKELILGKILTYIRSNCNGNNAHDLNVFKYACNCWDSVAKDENNYLIIGGLRKFFINQSPGLIKWGL